MRLDVSVALSLLAVAIIATGTASAQISDDIVRIGVLNDQSNVYADLGGQGSVIAARMAIEDVTGLGVAVSSAEERQSPTWVAGVAEVTVDTKTGRYRINRLTVAMDPGTVINPRNATAQIQGAALWGASQVMAERLTLKDGGIEQSNFHEYTPIRLADVPPIDVELIDSGHHPSGVGEPASTVVAPAVANAIYNAVGVRVRHMPITAEAVLEGLKKKA